MSFVLWKKNHAYFFGQPNTYELIMDEREEYMPAKFTNVVLKKYWCSDVIFACS